MPLVPNDKKWKFGQHKIKIFIYTPYGVGNEFVATSILGIQKYEILAGNYPSTMCGWFLQNKTFQQIERILRSDISCFNLAGTLAGTYNYSKIDFIN